MIGLLLTDGWFWLGLFYLTVGLTAAGWSTVEGVRSLRARYRRRRQPLT